MRYDKLVRDGIPELIAKKGGTAKWHVASEAEYAAKLKDKLREEVEEFLKDDSVGELADILEVVQTLAADRGTSPQDLEALRAKKTAERGGFRGRIILEES